MTIIIFESHGTTMDNEANLSSGFFDVSLSARGEREAQELGKRYKNEKINAVYCSDLQRGYQTAELAFSESRIPIIRDSRLRECDYGQLTRHPSNEVSGEKHKHIHVPFPGGQSYEQTTELMRSFLLDVLANHHAGKIIIIGHRATQYALEHLINGVALETALTAPWKWQPGWTYYLEKV